MELLVKLHRFRTAAIAGLCLLCARLDSNQIRAECGDYVIVGRSAGLASPGMRAWESRSMPFDISSGGAPSRHSSRPACHGPSCRAQDPLPVPSSTMGPTTVSQWAHMIPFNEASTPRSPRPVPAVAFSHLEGHVDPVFHPPRPVL